MELEWSCPVASNDMQRFVIHFAAEWLRCKRCGHEIHFLTWDVKINVMKRCLVCLLFMVVRL